MSAVFAALAGEADRWLQQATQTYLKGEDFAQVAAEAGIAQAYLLRAALEKPDTFASIMQVAQMEKLQQQQQEGAAAAPPPPPPPPTPEAAAEAASKARHPAGSKRSPRNGAAVAKAHAPKKGPAK